MSDSSILTRNTADPLSMPRSPKVFSKFDLCLSSSKESKNYLNKLGAKSSRFLGNLKFSQSENEIIEMDKGLEKFIKSRKSWCASSTHKSEEVFCANVHKELKKKYLITNYIILFQLQTDLYFTLRI